MAGRGTSDVARNVGWALAGVAPWVEHQPACEPKDHGFDSQSGHMPGFWVGPWLGVRERQAIDIFLTWGCFFPSLPPYPSL